MSRHRRGRERGRVVPSAHRSTTTNLECGCDTGNQGGLWHCS
jgi:hypothetical protein